MGSRPNPEMVSLGIIQRGTLKLPSLVPSVLVLPVISPVAGLGRLQLPVERVVQIALEVSRVAQCERSGHVAPR